MMMSKTTRNIAFRLHPTAGQTQSLFAWLDLHRELYNATLRERRDAYQKCRVSLTYHQQQNELPAVKKARPELISPGQSCLAGNRSKGGPGLQGVFPAGQERGKTGVPQVQKQKPV